MAKAAPRKAIYVSMYRSSGSVANDQKKQAQLYNKYAGSVMANKWARERILSLTNVAQNVVVGAAKKRIG